MMRAIVIFGALLVLLAVATIIGTAMRGMS